jgi:hypothetical protein
MPQLLTRMSSRPKLERKLRRLLRSSVGLAVVRHQGDALTLEGAFRIHGQPEVSLPLTISWRARCRRHTVRRCAVRASVADSIVTGSRHS